MSRPWGQVPGQFADDDRIEHPARVRRLLRNGPRTQPARRPASRAGASTAPARPAAPQSRTLAEWHDMTPGERAVAWTGLRAWVTWLHDRYELSVEDRLPRCWPRHPGIIEELLALKAWREEIYNAAQPNGQAARYWHAELRQVLHAATSMYAAGCRTGHRGASVRAARDADLLQQWAQADPLAATPAVDIAAGRARLAGQHTSGAVIAAAIDGGQAHAVPGMRDHLLYGGTLWAPAASGWIQAPSPDPGDFLPPPGPGRTRTGQPPASEDEEQDPWKD